jgi:hypothetical protein
VGEEGGSWHTSSPTGTGCWHELVSLHSPRADRGGSILRLTDCGCCSSNPLATPKRITYELLYPRDIPRARMRDKDWQLRSCRWFNLVNGQSCRLFVRLHVGLLADMHGLQKVGCT